MIVVRTIFQAKWGQGRELTQIIRASRPGSVGGATHTYRLWSALDGNFDTVVLDVEMESLAAMEAFRGPMFADPNWQQAQREISPLLESGSLEFYTLEDQG